MRKVRIACILQSKFNDFRANPAFNDREVCCQEALELLDEAGTKGVDLALLSETFSSGGSECSYEST